MQKTAACVLLINSVGQILGTTRRNKPTLWGLPGGKIDPGETTLAAALRELEEETGVKLSFDRVVLIYEGPCEDWWTTTYLAYWKNTDPVPHVVESDIDVKWIDWQLLQQGPFGDYNTHLMRAYNSYLTCSRI